MNQEQKTGSPGRRLVMMGGPREEAEDEEERHMGQGVPGDALILYRPRSDSVHSRYAAGTGSTHSVNSHRADRGSAADDAVYLADGGQFGEQHLEDRRRQSLLQHLQQLLRLAAHCDGVGQVVHTLLVVSCGRSMRTLVLKDSEEMCE